jgi:hypothetical protein
LTVNGATGEIAAYFDGNFVFGTVDNAYTGGKLGLWSNGKTCCFDNVKVSQYVEVVNISKSINPVTAAPNKNDPLIIIKPNPCGDRTFISIHGQISTAPATITIYNLQGTKIRSLAFDRATGQCAWNGKNDFGEKVQPGVYWATYAGFGQKIFLIK